MLLLLQAADEPEEQEAGDKAAAMDVDGPAAEEEQVGARLVPQQCNAALSSRITGCARMYQHAQPRDQVSVSECTCLRCNRQVQVPHTVWC